MISSKASPCYCHRTEGKQPQPALHSGNLHRNLRIPAFALCPGGTDIQPVSGQEVKKHSTEDIVNCMLQQPEGTRYTVLAPILLREGRTLQQQLEIDMKQGFNRLEVNGEMVRIDEYQPKDGDTLFSLVDRMTASCEKDAISRLTDSAETAMYEATGPACYASTSRTQHQLYRFSTKFERTA